MKHSVAKHKPGSQKRDSYKVEKDRSYGPMVLAILVFFVGIFTIVGLYNVTLISFFTLTQFIVGFMVVGFLIPLRFYSKWFHFIKYETIIFNVMGVAPFLTGLFLVLNFLIVSDAKTEEFKIEKLYFGENNKTMAKGVILEGNAYADEPKIVEVDKTESLKMYFNSHLRITLAKGLFGLEVIKDKEFFNNGQDAEQ